MRQILQLLRSRIYMHSREEHTSRPLPAQLPNGQLLQSKSHKLVLVLVLLALLLYESRIM